MVLIAAFAPLVWAKVCTIRWRSKSYRGLLIGGAAVGCTGGVLLVTGAMFRPATWLFPLADTFAAEGSGILVLLGWFFIPEGTLMVVLGIVIRLTFGATDGQR